MNTTKNSSWERAPYDGVVGKSWHEKICTLVQLIVNTANAKHMRVGGYRGWLLEDIRIEVSPMRTETPWHIEGPGCAVYGTGPVEALEKLLEMVRKA